MLAISYACAVVGIEGLIVEVQVDFNPRAGIPSFIIVGLPDSAVRESRERVRAAIKNTNYSTQKRLKDSSPQISGTESTLGGQRRQEPDYHSSGLRFPNKAYTVNLSPANLPKHSTAYDLAIAVGVLAATDQIPTPALDKALYIGELSLDGRIRHVKGVMPMAYTAYQEGFHTLYVAPEDAAQAALIDGIQVIPVETLGQLVEHLYGLNPITPFHRVSINLNAPRNDNNYVDFSHIKGQQHIKRALEVAAAGNHNVRMMGQPGVGKSLLSRAIPAILPSLTFEEAMEVTRLYSVADMLDSNQALVTHRPFQSPHHTISSAGLIGGGSIPKPGAVTLSHRGILFLNKCKN